MGYSQSWLAVKGKPPAAVLAALGLCATGTREDVAESPLVGLELPRGWYLIVANRTDHHLMRENSLQRLSAGCEVVTGDVEEHVMVSSATGWKDGRRVWSVLHDAQRGVDDLTAEGDLPGAFEPIRNRLCGEQQAAGGEDAKVDCIFDIPVELAETLTGYRHDARFPGGVAPSFEVLSQSSFRKRLFGS